MILKSTDSEKDEIRTIQTVINLYTGEYIYAKTFFQQEEHVIWDYRSKCQEAIKGNVLPFLVCNTCGQLIQISGGKGTNGKIIYFKHLKDSRDCPVKTDTKLSKLDILRGKFNGQKEGKLHKETKQLISCFLELNKNDNKGISVVEIEKVMKSDRNYLEWKKPDISALFCDKRIVFEIQLSTTFLDVICERQAFYKENKTFILWVFKEFEIELDKQRFTQKDVFYSNNRNAFVFDQKAIDLSNENRNLYLLCVYQVAIVEREELAYKWESEYVRLNDLIFDENYKVYFYDVEEREKKVLEYIKTQKAAKVRREQERLLELEEKYNDDYQEDEVPTEIVRQSSSELRHINYKENNKSFLERLNQYDNLSPLQCIFKLPIAEIIPELHIFFKGGYIPTKEEKDFFSKADKDFLSREYKIELNNAQKADKDSALYLIAIALFYVKIYKQINIIKIDKYREYVEALPKLERTLIAILSIKQERVIGYGFEKLISIPNQFLDIKNVNSKIHFVPPLLKAIEEYPGSYNAFMEKYDKKGIFRKKLQLLESNTFSVPKEYIPIFDIIF